MKSNTVFSKRILLWFDQYGRKNLPWQQDTTAYRVWLSEIMLQQTQVETVIPYYAKFMQAFPTLEQLAAAPLDDVLHLWTGLGYYARARNLHKCAQHLCQERGGTFPDTADALEKLPGIGRSTAGSIASIAFKNAAPILDGNVKRVLARYHAVDGWPGNKKVADELWKYASAYTPERRCEDYTQAIMDLGATVCKRSSPLCERCPLQAECEAHKQGRIGDFPSKKPKKALPVKSLQMLLIENPEGHVLLELRPSKGIWGGLWSLPELGSDENVNDHLSTRYGDKCSLTPLPRFRHTFSHYHLDVTPFRAVLSQVPSGLMEPNSQLWYNPRQPQKIGLAAPVKKLLTETT